MESFFCFYVTSQFSNGFHFFNFCLKPILVGIRLFFAFFASGFPQKLSNKNITLASGDSLTSWFKLSYGWAIFSTQ